MTPSTTQWTYPLGKRATNLHFAADGVAAKYGCRVWLEWSGEGDERRCELRFLGTADARKSVLLLLPKVERLMRIEWQGYRFDVRHQRHWDVWHEDRRSSWERGFCESISRRLSSKVQVSRAVQRTIEASFARLSIGRLTQLVSHARPHPDAYDAGCKAAERVDITLRPLPRRLAGSDEE